MGWVSTMAANDNMLAEAVQQAPHSGENEHGIKIIRVDGLVKWFDVGRGYGFVIPDNGLPDILIHLSCLKRDGFEAPLEGTRVACEVVARQKGYQCLRVLAVDQSTAIHPNAWFWLCKRRRRAGRHFCAHGSVTQNCYCRAHP
jgi:cold shock CspA family protein